MFTEDVQQALQRFVLHCELADLDQFRALLRAVPSHRWKPTERRLKALIQRIDRSGLPSSLPVLPPEDRFRQAMFQASVAPTKRAALDAMTYALTEESMRRARLASASRYSID
ncbi:MAG: hypothetical protein NZ518_06625 [Dehalococcoidia bacterium]|nr:hypothetical protein [Dehalococcoidia bacterium]